MNTLSVPNKIILLLFIAILAGCTHSSAETKIAALRCEYLENPIGIDVAAPRFTWTFESGKKDMFQTAYQLNIATSPELLKEGKPDIYQSEKTESKTTMAALPDKISLQSFTKYYWNVNCWVNKHSKPVSSPAMTFETAMMHPGDWSAKWISDGNPKETEPAPQFRKEMDIRHKKIRAARMYISGLGYYEAFINGERVGKNILDPGYTAFDKRVYYIAHDVTKLVKPGVNSIAAVLGNGWYNEQSVAVWNFHQSRWRNRPRMICEIRVDYADGTTDKIVSDGTWKTAAGAHIYDNIYSGDMIDARLDEKGWELPGFDDSKWNAAQIVSDFNPILQSGLFPPIQITKEIPAARMKKFSDKLYVYDFGENFSGFCRLEVKGEPGTKIRLKHGELLDSLGRLEQNNINVFYRPLHEKEIFQSDVFILDGKGKEVFQPAFTYHGFQYVEVESDKPVALTKKSLTGLFLHTNVKQTGHFSCSNETLNKLWAATNQSYLSNLHSIPTDCPQREKNGWTADAHVAIEAGLWNFDGIKIYEKWMRDFIDNIRDDGRISGIIPSAGWGYEDWIGPIWDAALFIVPDELYNFYGDKTSIETLYPTMERYLQYLATREVDGGILNYGISDWLTFKTTTPNDYTTTVYYYIDHTLMAKFARLLGKDASPYLRKAESLKKIIHEKFYHPETNTYSNASQTALALALYAEIVPAGEAQKVADKLAGIIGANNGKLDFGLLGTKSVPRMLTKYGYAELALKMIVGPDAPSWGYWVGKLGYTTLPETWTLHPELKDGSLNHVFFGDVSAWMYQYLAGINYDKKNPGFEHIIIAPNYIDGIDWVKSEYNSVKGTIRSEWKRKNDRVTLHVEIPAGTTASVKVGEKTTEIGSGKYQYNIKLTAK